MGQIDQGSQGAEPTAEHPAQDQGQGQHDQGIPDQGDDHPGGQDGAAATKGSRRKKIFTA